MVHDIPTVRTNYTKILTGIVAIFGFRIFFSDVWQAHLQIAENLVHDVFNKPRKELCRKPNQLLQALKPLYGLDDSCNYWGRALRFHLLDNLGMQTAISDAELCIKRVRQNLAGLCAWAGDNTAQVDLKLIQD